MTIRKRLAIIAILPPALALLVGLYYAVTSSQIRQQRSDSAFADNLTQDVYDLAFISGRYLIYREKTIRDQWLRIHAAMGARLATGRLAEMAERKQLATIRVGHLEIEELFSQVVLFDEQDSSAAINSIGAKRRERLTGAILIKAGDIYTTAKQLSEGTRSRLRATRDRFDAAILILICAVALVTSIIAALTGKSIIATIGMLRQGTEKVAEGDLEHVVAPQRGDELGVLAVAFNRMTERLKRSVEALHREISERAEAEEALRVSAEEIENLYNTAPCGYHSLDPDGLFVRINDTTLQWLGYSRDEVLGKLKFFDLIAGESSEVFHALSTELREEDVVQNREYDLVRKDGSILPVMMSSVALFNDDGAYTGCRANLYDVTERRTAENHIFYLNRLYAVLSRTSQAIVHNYDRHSLFRDVCRVAVEQGDLLFAWIGIVDEETGIVKPVAWSSNNADYLHNIQISAREEPEGRGPTGTAIRTGRLRTCSDLLEDPQFHPWREEAARRGFRSSAAIPLKLQGKSIGVLTMYAAEKDFFRWQLENLLEELAANISYALEKFHLENKSRDAERALHEEMLGRLQAIEALRERERLLILQGRQAAMGEMVGNIAHQWRQPLNTLGLLVQELPLMYETGRFDKGYLCGRVEKCKDLIFHMSNTIENFNNFLKPDQGKITFSIREVVGKAASLVEGSFRAQGIKLVVNASEDAVIHGFPSQYIQVLLNILLNARDAFSEQTIYGPQVTITLQENGAHMPVVIIADNAGGVPPEMFDQIFEPFFTTKGAEKGGVGLFMSKTIIERNMNGSLTARNVGEGAEFRIEV